MLMSASTKTKYRSTAGVVYVDALTHQILTTANRLLALPQFGSEVEPMTATQGSFRPKTSYSGTTHTGCAAVDLTAYNWRNRITVLDLLGAIGCHRTPAQGNWPYHIHTMTNGMGCAAPSLKGQIAEVMAGGDGLAGNKRDPNRDLRSLLWPLAVWRGRTGSVTSKQHTHLYPTPAYHPTWKVDAPKGTSAVALMEVAVNRERWFVTNAGLWGASAKWV